MVMPEMQIRQSGDWRSRGRRADALTGGECLRAKELGGAWMGRNGSCRPYGASCYFNADLPPLSRWATLFRP
jgi:hypothetical protein